MASLVAATSRQIASTSRAVRVPAEPARAFEAERHEPLALRAVAEQRQQRLPHDSGSGSASRAAPPQVSGSAVVLAATTGVPAAIASSTGRPKPS